MRDVAMNARRVARRVPGAAIVLLPSLALAAPHGAEGGNPLTQFNPGLLLWTIITFIALLVILRWKAWPAIVSALKAREEAVRGAIENARKEREEAQQLLEEHRKTLADARKETAAMIDKGRQDAERVRNDLLDKARKEQQELLEQGRRQIEHETRAAVAGLREHTVDLAIAASERLISERLDDESHRKLVEQTLQEMAKSGGGAPATGR